MIKILQRSFKLIALLLPLYANATTDIARDLAEIKEEGILRHIGTPYANFITFSQEANNTIQGGLDVELIKGFAKYLGVKYQYVPATWSNQIALLTGQSAHYIKGKLIRGQEKSTIQGDLIANGSTILPWREEVVSYSDSYSPSGVWLIARADSKLTPIQPSGSIIKDIEAAKLKLKNTTLLVMAQTCLDPYLYNLHSTQAQIVYPEHARKLNELVPAIMNNDAETTLLDVSEALLALEKWPSEIKVIGPISEEQKLGVAFRKDAPELKKAFNQYLQQQKQNGELNILVKKYYPSAFNFYSSFFHDKSD